MNHKLSGFAKLIFFIFIICSFFIFNSRDINAEGSRELVSIKGDTPKTKGFRPYIDHYRENYYYASGNNRLRRKQIIKAYAKQGEVIYFGTSVSLTQGDNSDVQITVKSPSGSSHNYYVDKGNGKGYIANTSEESNGPRGIHADGYDPLEFDIKEEGIYEFEFFSKPSKDISPEPVPLDSDLAWNDNYQGSGVCAWDVTVSKDNKPLDGRVFANYLTMTLGTNRKADYNFLNSIVYVLTSDGYIYETNFNGINANGFLFFANNRGLVNTATNKPFYHSSIYTDNTTTNLLGGIGFQIPSESNTDKDIIYRIFFNYPNKEFLEYLGLSKPIRPAGVENFMFENGNGTGVGKGGYFSFYASKASSYRIELNLSNGSNVYLMGDCIQGQNKVHWDGMDANKNVVSSGIYGANITLKGGEYHFPIADAEVNKNGIQIRLTNIPNDASDNFNPYTVYYDNSDIFVNGDKLDFVTGSQGFYGDLSKLNGVNSKKNEYGVSDALRYTTTDKSVNANTNGYGDLKIFDVWTYYSSKQSTAITDVKVAEFGSLTIEKKVIGNFQDLLNNFMFETVFSGSGEYEYTGSKSGTVKNGGKISLGNNEKITISGLPIGMSYHIKEESSDEYDVMSSGNVGVIKAGESRACFENRHKNTDEYESPDVTSPNVPKTSDNLNYVFEVIPIVYLFLFFNKKLRHWR